MTAVIVPLDGWLSMRTPIDRTVLFQRMANYYDSMKLTCSEKEKVRLANFFERLLLLISVYLPKDMSSSAVLASIKEFRDTGKGPFGEACFKAMDRDCNGSICISELSEGMQVC